MAQKSYTWEEVAKHNTPDNCWVAIDSKVYDITNFFDSHPGGKEYLALAAGRDATDLFHSYHTFTDRPESILPKYQIGVLSTTEFTKFKPDSGFYKELRQEVGNYFTKNKLHPKDPIPGLTRLVLFLTVLFSCYYTTYYTQASTMTKIFCAIIHGWLQAMILIHQMHDASHSAIGYNETWWKIIGRFTSEWVAGASIVAWHHQHVIGHHIYTNIMGADPDLPVAREGDLRFLIKQQLWSHYYKYQHLYMPPLYGFLTIKVRLQDFTHTFFSGTNGPVRVNPLHILQWINIFVAKFFNIAFLVLIPLFYGVLDWKSTILFWCLQDLICGYYLAFNFQVSHISTEAFFPCSEKLDPTLKDEWAVIQVITSVDYGHENGIWAFLSGALNYQSVHHLFPGVSQYHYPAIAPIIRRVCKKWKIPFNHVEGGFPKAFWLHVAYLRDMGNKTLKAHPGVTPVVVN